MLGKLTSGWISSPETNTFSLILKDSAKNESSIKKPEVCSAISAQTIIWTLPIIKKLLANKRAVIPGHAQKSLFHLSLLTDLVVFIQK